jgi:hypothetical protein
VHGLLDEAAEPLDAVPAELLVLVEVLGEA